MKLGNLFLGSFVALVAAGAVNATTLTVASREYVDAKIQPVNQALQNRPTNAEMAAAIAAAQLAGSDSDIDLSGYLTTAVASETYETKEHASETYQPKGTYLTEHQSLASYLTTTDAAETYQPKGSYLTTTAASETYQAKGDYLTSSDLSGYATTAGVAQDYLSKTDAATTYQPAGNYLTTATAAETYQPIGQYATAAQGTLAATALQPADITTGNANGTIAVDGTNVPVFGLGTAAYAAANTFVTNPTLPSTSGDYLLKLNYENGNYTYSWEDAANFSGGGSGGSTQYPWDDSGW